MELHGAGARHHRDTAGREPHPLHELAERHHHGRRGTADRVVERVDLRVRNAMIAIAPPGASSPPGERREQLFPKRQGS